MLRQCRSNPRRYQSRQNARGQSRPPAKGIVFKPLRSRSLNRGRTVLPFGKCPLRRCAVWRSTQARSTASGSATAPRRAINGRLGRDPVSVRFRRDDGYKARLPSSAHDGIRRTVNLGRSPHRTELGFPNPDRLLGLTSVPYPLRQSMCSRSPPDPLGSPHT